MVIQTFTRPSKVRSRRRETRRDEDEDEVVRRLLIDTSGLGIGKLSTHSLTRPERKITSASSLCSIPRPPKRNPLRPSLPVEPILLMSNSADASYVCWAPPGGRSWSVGRDAGRKLIWGFTAVGQAVCTMFWEACQLLVWYGQADGDDVVFASRNRGGRVEMEWRDGRELTMPELLCV